MKEAQYCMVDSMDSLAEVSMGEIRSVRGKAAAVSQAGGGCSG